MGFIYGGLLLPLVCLSFLCPVIMGWTLVDDIDNSLVYSNSGPSWWAANWYNGGGRLVGGHSNLTNILPYKMTWHEAKGAGASVSLTFTGTRVSLNATICGTIYDTVVDFFIDGEKRGRYEHHSAGPVTLHDAAPCDPKFQVTIANFDDLEPAQHTFKAVSVGDSLFVVDSFGYEATVPIPESSSQDATTPVATTSLTSTIPLGEPVATTSASPPMPPPFTASRSTFQFTQSRTTMTRGAQPAAASMDVSASDSRIIYSPPGAWKQYSDARRAASCLEGTMSSSTFNSSLTYNFMAPAIQVYVNSNPNGRNFSISIDGQNQGIYSSYDASADPTSCSPRPLYSTMGLAENDNHTLILTVQDHNSDSTQGTVQFVGLRILLSAAVPSPSDNAPASPPNVGGIVGGVIGGLAGLALLVFLTLWWLRRSRHASDLHSPASDEEFISNFRREMVQRNQRALGPLWETDIDASTTTSAHLDGLTFCTLPRYHENVRERPVARDLSEADVDAISRRLEEVMRSQMEQAGMDTNDLGEILPSRELIDHLVEEQLQPHAL